MYLEAALSMEFSWDVTVHGHPSLEMNDLTSLFLHLLFYVHNSVSLIDSVNHDKKYVKMEAGWCFKQRYQ